MVTRKTLLAKGLALALASYPQVIAAEGFSGSDFLAWDKPTQTAFIRTSVHMAGVIASQARPEIAACLETWFSEDGTMTETRDGHLRDAVEQFQTHHPQAVILALIERDCGLFRGN